MRGTLDTNLIDDFVKGDLGDIQACYQNELVTSPERNGNLVLKFVIGVDGAGMYKAFDSMQFPNPTGGIVIVSYPFVFEPS